MLDGAPGVHSARFMDGSSYADKCREILRRMSRRAGPETPGAISLLCATGRERRRGHVFEGVCPGVIAPEARGASGFGYDPIFVPDGFDRTFAELGAETKNRISHRARAFAQVRDFLTQIAVSH